MATKTKRSAKKSSKSSKPAVATKALNSCLCGCGEKVARTLAQGHDARLRGMLLRGEVKNVTKEQREFAKSHGVEIGAQKKEAKKAA